MCQTDGLWVLAWLRLRRVLEDSSKSGVIGCRSSVAETTGKRMTSMHPRIRREANLRPAGAEWEQRHSPQTSSAISSLARLSNSSMDLQMTGNPHHRQFLCRSFKFFRNAESKSM